MKTCTSNILFYLAALIISGCAGTKPSIIKRAYHNLTAHYNGYFNGKVKHIAGVKQLEKAHVDNYDDIINVFKLGDAKQAQSIYSDMDEAIKKASVAIQRHEISKWVDDCYLLIGKSYFYKRDYEVAAQNFQYIITKFKPEPPKYKFLKYLKQKPLRHDALVGLSRSYIGSGNYDAAQSALDIANSELKSYPKKKLMDLFKKKDKQENEQNKTQYKFKRKLKSELAATNAQYQILQRQYHLAATDLADAIKYTRKKHVKTRYIYILAQINQIIGNGEGAIKNYTRVIKRNPLYEMEFNAKINIAESYEASYSSSGKGIENILKKMIRDEKNKEYRDRLYFSLAGIAHKQNKLDDAIKYYKLSLETNISNSKQKALSYLSLAKLYYNVRDYRNSKTFYDSSAVSLPVAHPEYSTVIDVKSSLTELVKNLDIISMEDSLQYLASLTKEERDYIIDEMITKEIESKEKKQLLEVEKHQLLQDIENKRQNQGTEIGSSWYFYNPSLISLGYSEFKTRWGNREFGENWRRSDKRSIEPANTTEADLTSETDKKNTVEQANITPTKQQYYANIPLSKEKLTKSHEKIIDALYGCGNIYREQLYNYPASITSFLEIIRRYPDNVYKLESYFNLYRLYDKISKYDSSQYYKQLLISKYPECEYAKILSDPDYLNVKNIEKSRLANFYEDTYFAYNNHQYDLVISRKLLADSLFPVNNLASKFDYLKTLSIGKLYPVDTFEVSLKEIIAKYPATDVSEHAQQILNKLANLKNSLPADTSNTDSTKGVIQNFLYNPTLSHFYILSLKNNTDDLTKVKSTFSNHNTKFHSLESLKIASILFNDSTQFITVKEFPDADKAKAYFYEIQNSNEILKTLADNKFDQFIINSENFNIVFKEKLLDDYLIFYKKSYLN